MLCPLARTEKKDQNSIWDYVCPVLYRERRGAKHLQTWWQKMQQRVRRRGKIPLCNDGWKMKRIRSSQSARGWTEEYCRYLDDLAPLDISYVATWKERSRYENMRVLKLNDGKHPGTCQIEMVFHMQLAHWELSNANKEERIQKSRKTNESDNDHSMKNCGQNLSGKDGIIGKSTGRRHHLQQIGGSQENGKNHNKNG